MAVVENASRSRKTEQSRMRSHGSFQYLEPSDLEWFEQEVTMSDVRRTLHSDELAYLSAQELAARIRRRELSPVEVIDDFIRRIEVRNPSLNALIYLDFEGARASAKEAERALCAGEPLGPLHGIPSALKDLFDFKPGWPASLGGIRALKHHVVNGYCAFCERMEKRGGAVFLGKTNSSLMGFRGTCDNYLFGPTRNPFNLSKNAGGSSGGSAAAVADGLLPIAEGTDAGGSIRIPSAWCGVYGYKASFGRVPFLVRPNAFGAADSPFLFEGPITRTVEDAAVALNVLAGHDPRDPFSLTGPTVDFTAATRRSIRGLKIAYSPNLDVFPVDGKVAETVGRALMAFEEAGAHVQEVKLGISRSQRELSDVWSRLYMLLNLQAIENIRRDGIDLFGQHRADFPPEYLDWVERTNRMSGLDFFRDRAVRSEVYDAFQRVFEEFDLLVTPTLACPPVDNSSDGNTIGPTSLNGVEIDPLIGWCLTYFVNFTGHPAASMPAGLSEGLPIGMQIIGRRNADSDVLAASAAFERLRPWQDNYRICRERPLQA
ncbi:amidase [Bradyrhizobium sp. WYCCWR 13022]|uniref:amidase n=1 Tax=unclassified Bradyrhizobium TaxID=2631580 RepID=UPI00263B396A|nr:amidase [Bradyrhizobium sp. WYCCWR 13022]MDN4985603.1 amidase [Bradyrhizobium sp. WYCCWR 13022]